MKKIIIAVAIAVSLMCAVSGYAFQTTYGTAGCGLGSMAFGNEPGVIQIFVATLNGTSGNQTFGMTSGTSNRGDDIFASGKRLNDFVQANMDNLAKNIAMGHGESLTTLAELMGISADNKPVFYSKLQSNFSNIFTSEKVESANVIDNIFTIING